MDAAAVTPLFMRLVRRCFARAKCAFEDPRLVPFLVNRPTWVSLQFLENSVLDKANSAAGGRCGSHPPPHAAPPCDSPVPRSALCSARVLLRARRGLRPLLPVGRWGLVSSGLHSTRSISASKLWSAFRCSNSPRFSVPLLWPFRSRELVLSACSF